MKDFVELEGSADCPMYHLYLIGGPHDGEIQNSFRPYDRIKINALNQNLTSDYSSIYEAKEQGEACLIWVSDYTYRIELHYVGRGEPLETPQAVKDAIRKARRDENERN